MIMGEEVIGREVVRNPFISFYSEPDVSQVADKIWKEIYQNKKVKSSSVMQIICIHLELFVFYFLNQCSHIYY